MESEEQRQDGIKQCCAAFYGSDAARILLGDSFHPGGVRLTHRIGSLMQLRPESKVLDVAAGRGTSAFYLGQTFGCSVSGVDLNEQNVASANRESAERGLAGRVRFEVADAEALPFAETSFDALLCECAFCTFPDKPKAAAEFTRVLRAGGQLGLSDITKSVEPLHDLTDLFAWIACIADAQPRERYMELLSSAGLKIVHLEDSSDALEEMIHQIRTRLLGAEVLTGLKRLEISRSDLSQAKTLALAASAAVTAKKLGYLLIVATKPGDKAQSVIDPMR